MKNLMRDFARDEDGAVTVDWVVLTAALVGIGLSVILALDDAILANGNAIRDKMAEVSTTDFTVTVTAGEGGGGEGGGGGEPEVTPPSEE